MNLQGIQFRSVVDGAFWVAMVCVVFRWMILVYNAIIQPQPPVGDEIHFISYLQFLSEKGIFESLSNRLAINYTILALPFSLFLDGLVALRLVNLLLISFFILYIFKKKFDHSKYIILLALFYAGKVGIFNVGINDALFAISFAVILIEFICIIRNGKTEYSNLLLISVAFSLTTRPLVVIYMPIYLVIAWSFCKFNIFKDVKFAAVISSSLVLLMHVPSMVVNHSPSWDDKTTESDMTWAQRQYLAQIQANSGLRPEGTHPSWDELRKYIDQNGGNSLPKTFVESIYFDWKLTIKEFFKDLYFSFKGLLLQTGSLVFIFIFGLYKGIALRNIALLYSFMPLVYALLVFSFIIISNVEWRWYAPVVFLLISSIGWIFEIIEFKLVNLFKLSLSLSTFSLSAIGVYNLF